MKKAYSVAELRTIRMLNIMRDDSAKMDIADIMINKEISIDGSENDYHNFSVDLARNDDYRTACILLDRGLERYPDDADLLADYLKYGSRCDKKEECKRCFEHLFKIDRVFWSSRAFVFSLDYLKWAAPKNKNGEEKVKESMLSLAKEYQTFFPKDEQSYLATADIYGFFSETDKVIGTLEEGINKVSIAPKCCLKYADILMEEGDYQGVIKTCAKGMRAAIQEQPSIDIGYLYYLSALAQDALLHENPDEIQESEVKKVYKYYRIAEKTLEPTKDTYREHIKTRITVLQIESDIPYYKDSDK